MRKSFVFLATCLFPGISQPAVTGSVLYQDRAEWSAVVGNDVTAIDFSAYDGGRPITIPPSDGFLTRLTLSGVTFSSARRFSFGSFFNKFVYATDDAVVRVDLPPNVTAIGAHVYPYFPTSGTYKVDVSTGETFSFRVIFTDEDGATSFLGLVSATPISWIEIRLNSNEVSAFNVIDNFSFRTGTSAGAASTSHSAACAARYRSYDPSTNTFLGYDGYRHQCRL
jgi:hypothetical protein